MAEPPDLIALGVLARPHGVRGELRLHPYNPESETVYALEELGAVWLRGPDALVRRLAVARLRSGPKGPLLTLEGVDGREAAEALRGHEVCVPREALPPLEDEDEHYVADLVGLRVRGDDGTVVGEVIGVESYPSVECLRVRSEDGEREVPLVEPWVQRVDLEAGEVVVEGFAEVPLQGGGRGGGARMRLEVVTLFPEMLASFREAGLLGKAVAAGRLELVTANPRDFATDRHRTVDDAPYGGGSGMVMMPGPVADALEALDRDRGGRSHRVLLTPQGAPMTQATASRFAALPAVTLVCGRYEGVDERIRGLVDEELSLGDFVLFGGEVAAMAIVEATARLVPGVLGNEGSLAEESHAGGLLEYPQYTRPAEFRGVAVPEVLRSGDHAAIARWRRKEALRRTRARRPDLLARAELTGADRALLAEIEAEEGEGPPGPAR